MKRAWTAADILPSGGSLTLLGIATTTDGVIVEADGPGSARCPSCRHQSVARHSRYWRTIKDLPAHGQAVTLRVRSVDGAVTMRAARRRFLRIDLAAWWRHGCNT